MVSGRQSSSLKTISIHHRDFVGFEEPSCVWLFLTFTWQRFVFKCWQAATQAGSLYMMDAVRCSVITLSADGFVCSLLPPTAALDSGREEEGARFLPWKL